MSPLLATFGILVFTPWAQEHTTNWPACTCSLQPMVCNHLKSIYNFLNIMPAPCYSFSKHRDIFLLGNVVKYFPAYLIYFSNEIKNNGKAKK